MTKMFYLTKFRVMHKHDSLSLSLSHFSDFGNLKKNKPNQPTKQASSLVRNSEDAEDEESTALL